MQMSMLHLLWFLSVCKICVMLQSCGVVIAKRLIDIIPWLARIGLQSSFVKGNFSCKLLLHRGLKPCQGLNRPSLFLRQN